MAYSNVEICPTEQIKTDSTSKSTSPQSVSPATLTTGLLSGLMLTACGGGVPAGVASSLKLDAAQLASINQIISAAEASRFLSQAGFGGTDDQISFVQKYGVSAWLDNQFSTPSDQSHWDWLMANGFNADTYKSTSGGIDASLWRKLMSSPDILRQRIALALSEIFVVSIPGLEVYWRTFAVAAYVDMLEKNSFGNFRALLEAVTLSPAMGIYLGMRGNQKENSVTGRQPDENYGREIMQLFSIGLYELKLDGTLKLDANGKPIETYNLDTITQISKVFTGWDITGYGSASTDQMAHQMAFNPKLHSPATKSFLGVTIPAGTDGVQALKITLDTLFNHPNVAPFISKQLIQRLVTSNPSPAYVERVARAFNSGTGGVRGDMKSVIRAILLDQEARPSMDTLGLTAGKLREPMIRLIQWARTFKVTSTNGKWEMGDTSDPAWRLAQGPLRSPTVFNFFRPGYVPPNNALGSPSLVAPELQIANETTVVTYSNIIQIVINKGFADLKPNYSAEIALAGDAVALVTRIAVLLCAGQLTPTNTTLIYNAVNTISAATDEGKLNRVKAAIMLVMCSPEYLVQK